MGCTNAHQAANRDWDMLGGRELEQPLREEWVKLVRADWLWRLANNGGVLSRRQDLPEEAFVSLRQLKEAGSYRHAYGITALRIIVLSYPWLQPGHPDPHGQNLQVIAKALWGLARTREIFGVLIDFTALFQVDPVTQERTEMEKEIFKKALPELNVFYAHPHTFVLKVTKFPAGYPHDPLFPYVLPDGANTNEYMERGWCFAESAISGLVKQSLMVLDVGKLPDYCEHLETIFVSCSGGRAPPMHPEDFKTQLDTKVFTSKRDDFAKVEGLYSKAFSRLVGNAKDLDFSGLSWGPDEARQLCRALGGSNNLKTLDLSSNHIYDEGAAAVGEAIRVNGSLRELSLKSNRIGSNGAVALAEALRTNTSLRKLVLTQNPIDLEGARALAEAIRVKKTLKSLHLDFNDSLDNVDRAALRKADPRGVLILDREYESPY